MSRYIDADMLSDALRHLTLGETDAARATMKITHYVSRMPTADVVEVVRCSECKYNVSNPRRFMDDDIILCYAWCEYLKEVNGFCSYGKRENFTGGGAVI